MPATPTSKGAAKSRNLAGARLKTSAVKAFKSSPGAASSGAAAGSSDAAAASHRPWHAATKAVSSSPGAMPSSTGGAKALLASARLKTSALTAFTSPQEANDDAQFQVSRVALSRTFYSDTKETMRQARIAWEESGEQEFSWKQKLAVVRQGIKRKVASERIARIFSDGPADGKKDDKTDIQEDQEDHDVEELPEIIKELVQKSILASDRHQQTVSEEADSSLTAEEKKSRKAEREAETLKQVTESLTRLGANFSSEMNDNLHIRNSLANLEQLLATLGLDMGPLMARVQEILGAEYLKPQNLKPLQSLPANGGNYQQQPESSDSEPDHRRGSIKNHGRRQSSIQSFKEGGKDVVFPDRSAAETSHDARRDSDRQDEQPFFNIQSLKAVSKFKRLIAQSRASTSPPAGMSTEARGALEHERPRASLCIAPRSQRLQNAQSMQTPRTPRTILQHTPYRNPYRKDSGYISVSPAAPDSSLELLGQADVPELELAALLQSPELLKRLSVADAPEAPELLEHLSGAKLNHTMEPASEQRTSPRKPPLSYSIERYHTVVVQDDGKAVAYGRNAECQCDISEAMDSLGTSAPFRDEVALTSGPAVVNESNQPGESATTAADRDGTYVEAAAGHFHTILLRNDGTAVAHGQNSEHQCDVPQLVPGSIYTHIAAGDFHTVLLRSDGTAASCGRNAERQCDIPPLQGDLTYTQVSAGRGSTVLLRSDGNVFCLGAAARSWGPMIPQKELELLGLGDSIEKLIRLSGL